MSSSLNTTPEVLLRKRRNADRIRLDKQEKAQERKELEKKRKRASKNKFVRAETIVAASLASEREREREKRASKLAVKRARGETTHVPTQRDFMLRVDDAGPADDGDEALNSTKVSYNGEPKLLFVVRVRGPTAARIPHKAARVLSLLRLKQLDTGVFVQLTSSVFALLRLVAPYVVVGQPSPATVRALVQKRGRVQDGETTVPLNDNNFVEAKLGDEGIICVEDIVHEITSLGDQFAKCVFFLQPIALSREVSGFSALSKLQRLRQREWRQRVGPVSNAAGAPLVEIDIDSLVSRLN
ncbi:LAMI_0A05644g1_1 [Lachancea mirantina]|uniref:Ribosome biogenesis protein RLP7 n=1 Tax=Lachancea mirantina TaxID=1230905 RepID=A0A1G4IQD1_9SACH|nr:LAMI_0A05644g1_1 [Lachancea mirantina]